MKYRNEAINISKLAYPILFNYILTSVFELLDVAIVGHYSVQGFALVGVASAIIYSVTGALGVLSAAFNIIAADKKGKKDEAGFEQSFISSKKLASIMGVVFILISILFGRMFFQKVYGLEGEALKELLSYFYPASVTVLQNMMIFLYSAYFRNKLNTKIGVYVTFISTAVNLFFDYALVYGKFGFPELGVSGAAWGSVIGLFTGLLVYQAAYYKNVKWSFALQQARKKSDFVRTIKELAVLYPSLLGQEFFESTVFVLIVTAVVARLGTEEMAVYKLLDSVYGILGLPAYAYATATQTYTLQSYSANKISSVKDYLKAGSILGTVVTILLCTICYIWREKILQWILPDSAVITLACNFLWLIFLIVIVKVFYQIYLSYLQGIDKEKYVCASTIIGTIISSILVVVLSKYFNLAGIYLVMILEYISLACCYIKKSQTKY